MSTEKNRLACDICGGQLRNMGNGEAECLNCGMTYSIQSLKEKYENVTVNVTGSEQDVEKWRVLLRMYMNNADYIHAEEIVNKMLEAEPTDEEAKTTYSALQQLKFFEIRNRVLIKYSGSESTVAIPGIVEMISSRAFEDYVYKDEKKQPVPIRKIILPAGIKEIKQTFAKLRKLEEIVLPEGLETIGEDTFLDCVSLTTINLPNSLTSIENHAFNGCSSLVNVALPSSVSVIGAYAFANCCSIKEITIPSPVHDISNFAFANCSSLTTVKLSKNITSIGSNAFCGCKSLVDIHLPNSIKTIGDYAFGNCSALERIETPVEASIKPSSFGGCYFREVQYEGVWYKTKQSRLKDYDKYRVLYDPYYFSPDARKLRADLIRRKVCIICGESHRGPLALLSKVCLKCRMQNKEWINQSEDFIIS